ncbi:MAG TPA: hypothetical protein VEW45_01150 [Candidatus Dormibacteraeota bacterium]|nr:hypothetical protein [Candidatus Dormibacteraeota bacterium]
MKAFAIDSTDTPASLIDLPKPKIGEIDVLVAVMAASAGDPRQADRSRMNSLRRRHDERQ